MENTSNFKNPTYEDISLRRQRTKQEIQVLKEELEKLITSGINSTKATSGNYPGNSTAIKKIENEEANSAPVPTELKNTATKLSEIQPLPGITLRDSKLHTVKEAKNKNFTGQVCSKLSPKKTRSYNVKEAREFIKKQKEKRTEELKLKLKESQASIDIRKEKLKQLHEKALLLVTKNVQQKKEKPVLLHTNCHNKQIRSKSSDRNLPVSRSRSKSGDRNLPKKYERSRSVDRMPNKQPTVNGKETSSPKEQVFQQKLSNRHIPEKNDEFGGTKKVQHQVKSASKDKDNHVSTDVSASKYNVVPKRNPQKASHTKSENTLKTNVENQDATVPSSSSKLSTFLSVPDIPITNNEKVNSGNSTNLRVELEKEPYPSNKKILKSNGNVSEKQSSHIKSSPNLSYSYKKELELQKDYLAVPKIIDRPSTSLIDMTTKIYGTRFNEKENANISKHKSKQAFMYPKRITETENTIMLRHKSDRGFVTNNSSKQTKDTQTYEQRPPNETPQWLQAPNNLNFINTVKKKLKLAVGSPINLRDAETQSSFIEQNNEKNIDGDKSNCESNKKIAPDGIKHNASTNGCDGQQIYIDKNKLGQNDINTNLKSFLSHKCLELNLEKVANLELCPKLAVSKSDHIKGSKLETSDICSSYSQESDYDTSKNIPDISSEISVSQKSKLSSNVEKINENITKPEIDITSLKQLNLTRGTGCWDGVTPIVQRNSSSVSSQNKRNNNNSSKEKTLETESLRTYRSREHSEKMDTNTNQLKTINLQRGSEIGSSHGTRVKQKSTGNSPSKHGTNNDIHSSNNSITEESCGTSGMTENSGASSRNTITGKGIDSSRKTITGKSIDSWRSSIKTDQNTVIISDGDSAADSGNASEAEKLKVNKTFDVPLSEIKSDTIISKASTAISSNEYSKSFIPESDDSSGALPSGHSNESSKIQKSNSIRTVSVSVRSVQKKSNPTSVHSTSETVKESLQPSNHSANKSHLSSNDVNKQSEKNTLKSSAHGLTKTTSGSFLEASKCLNENNFTNENILQLKEPSLHLQINSSSITNRTHDGDNLLKNISNRSEGVSSKQLKNNTNEIHLKFEAEVHLLNDFNESLKQFMAVEKAFETLKQKNESPPKKTYQTTDTQTSIVIKTPTSSKVTENSAVEERSNQISKINYSRGYDISEDLQDIPTDRNISRGADSSFMSTTGLTGFELSNVNDSINSSVDDSKLSVSTSVMEKHNGNIFGSISLKMFEQLIKDEDIRIENLKTIIKIREKSLLDRTKTELALLEIQRKHLKETGQLDKVSDIRKRQRGIILKHEHEKYEMQKLKQMQKAASKERKLKLKEESNLIKAQLTTDNMLSQMKVSTPRRKRQSGPFRVIQSHSETVRSEASLSRKNSMTEEVLSITSHSQSVASVNDDISGIDHMNQSKLNNLDLLSGKQLSQVKQTLLMREAALQKRRKAAEELLKWHQKLLDEEKKISELESATNIVINQIPSVTATKSDMTNYSLKGSQLNDLWQNITGSRENKFINQKTYTMSQAALEKFYKSSKEASEKRKKIEKIADTSTTAKTVTKEGIKDVHDIPEKLSSPKNSVRTDTSSQVDIPSELDDRIETLYSSDFDSDSIKIGEVETNYKIEKIPSISELIDNFSKIKEEISSLSEKTEKDILSINIQEDLVFSSEVSSGRESENSVSTNLSGKKSIVDTISAKENEKSSEGADNSKGVNDIFQNNKNEVMSDINSVCSAKDESSKTSVKNSSPPEKIVSEKLYSVSKSSGNTDTIEEMKEDLHTEEHNHSSESVHSECDDTTNNFPSSSSPAKSVTEKDETESHIASIESKLVESIEKSLNLVNNSAPLSEKGEIVSSHSSHVDKNDIHDEVEEHTEHVTDISSTERAISLKEDINSFEVKEKDDSEEVPSTHSDNNSSVITTISTPKLKDTDSKAIKYDVSAEILSCDVAGKVLQSETPSISPQIKSPVMTDMNTSDSKTDIPEEEHNNLKTKSNYSSQSLSESKVPSGEDNQEVCGEESEHLNDITSIAQFEEAHSVKQTIESAPRGQEISENISDVISERSDISKLKTSASASSSSEHLSTESVVDIKADLQISKDECDIKLDINLRPPCGDQGETNINLSSSTVASVSLENKDENETNQSRISLNERDNLPEANASELQDSDGSKVSVTSNDYSQEFPSHEGDEPDSQADRTFIEDSDVESLEVSTEKEASEQNKTEKSIDSMEKNIDVKTRVSQILADANQHTRGDKSPRLQDLYTTTYDLMSPVSSPESSGSPERKASPRLTPDSIFGDEAKQLMMKQLAIEQEIKQLEQQQKEQIPYVFMREIPNKPPPPYTPPGSKPNTSALTILPSDPEDISEVVSYASNVLHKAYISNNLVNVKLKECNFKLVTKRNINKQCCQFLLDLCMEFALNHYKQFEEPTGPSWLRVHQKPQFGTTKPFDIKGLERFLNDKLKEQLGFKKCEVKESAIIKWSRKKRDHVEEILIAESQCEENEWTNYEKDEVLVKNELTSDIMRMLLIETADIFSKLLSKKTFT